MPETRTLDYHIPPKRRNAIRRTILPMVAGLALAFGLLAIVRVSIDWFRTYQRESAQRALTAKLEIYQPVPDVLCWSSDPRDRTPRAGYAFAGKWLYRLGPQDLSTDTDDDSDPLFVYIGHYWAGSETLKAKPTAIRFAPLLRLLGNDLYLESVVDIRSSEAIVLPTPFSNASTIRLFTAKPYAPDARVFSMRVEIDGQPQWLHIDFDRSGRDRAWLSMSELPTTQPYT